jgi:L-alanine-DL-glutamate epimerase-like enolase superfamily enzyme
MTTLPITRVEAHSYTIPTDAPESDGTIAWDSTTVVIAEVEAGDARGIGYSYADASAAPLIERVLSRAVAGLDAMDLGATWVAMTTAVRNIGRSGVASSAISALDVALWDAKARAFGLSLGRLLGKTRDAIAAYGSGGFTSYDDRQLAKQLGGWARDGLRAVKMKVGRDPDDDVRRVKVAREAIGRDVELFVDANGALHRAQALAFAESVAPLGVTWFEEPVTSDDPGALRLLRERVPAGMRIAAGEYAYTPFDARRLLEANAVDVLQADATRCGGVSGFLRLAALAESHCVPLSAHTSPTLHATLCCVAPPAINVEYFHDHARIEQMLFDGAVSPVNGQLVPDDARPGLGIELRRRDARRWAA